jgi:hypothetical protein
VLRAPANAEEAKLKSRHIARSVPFRDCWCEEDPSFSQKIIEMFSKVPA